MMKITGLSHLFKWENLHNWWLTKYFFAPLYTSKLAEDWPVVCINSSQSKVIITHGFFNILLLTSIVSKEPLYKVPAYSRNGLFSVINASVSGSAELWR